MITLRVTASSDAYLETGHHVASKVAGPDARSAVPSHKIAAG